jgi:hypothetical protein
MGVPPGRLQTAKLSADLRNSWRDLTAKLVNRLRLHIFVAWHRAITKKKAELYSRA